MQRLAPMLEPAAGVVLRLSWRPNIFEVGETIEEFTADQVEVPIAVEVGKVGGRRTEDIDLRATGQDRPWRLIVGLAIGTPVAEPIDVAV